MYGFTVEGPGPRGRLGPLRQWNLLLQAGGHWILLLLAAHNSTVSWSVVTSDPVEGFAACVVVFLGYQ